jgi:hypothetical protein
MRGAGVGMIVVTARWACHSRARVIDSLRVVVVIASESCRGMALAVKLEKSTNITNHM